MATEGVDLRRRRFLTATMTVVGGAGAVAAAIPFVASMQPSARARAAGAPVEVDISALEPGQKMTVEWRGKPVWIVRRTEDNLADLKNLDEQVADPASEVPQQPGYAKNENRAINDEYLIVVGLCTHLGCSPTHITKLEPKGMGEDWKGGFYCPCHGSKFDLAGRVYKSVPAPTNMVVPPHRYLSDARVQIGVDQESA